MSRKPNATKQYCDAATANDDDKEANMNEKKHKTCVYMCVRVSLCLCSNLFSYVLQICTVNPSNAT